jgi:hypothetical protein
VKSQSGFVVIASLTASLLCVPATADIPPPGTCECSGHVAGDLCVRRANGCGLLGTGDPTDGGAGVCTSSTCSGIDHAHWDHDAMPLFPPYIMYPCLICQVDASTAPPSDAAVDVTALKATDATTLDVAPSDGASAEASLSEPSVDATTFEAADATMADVGPPDARSTSGGSSGGCSASADRNAGTLAGLLAVGGIVALFFERRRSRLDAPPR